MISRKSRGNISSQPFWNNIKIVPYLFILPNMVLFITFMIIPIFMTFYYSLTKWTGLGPPVFIGLSNYTYIFKDHVFLKSLLNTVYFTLLTVPLTMLFALLFAMLLNNKIHFKGFFRGALYISSIVSTVVVGMVFNSIFSSELGLINYFFSNVGLPSIDWYNDPRFAIVMIVTGTLWGRIGSIMVIYLAGLQGISGEFYESAQIDGATVWQKFIFITWPLLKSTNVFVVITSVISAFRSFDIIYVMTRGGPLNSTKTLVMYIFEIAFMKNNFGLASSGGIILLMILLVFTYFRLKTEKED